MANYENSVLIKPTLYYVDHLRLERACLVPLLSYVVYIFGNGYFKNLMSLCGTDSTVPVTSETVVH